jgi:hypothetical protein
LSFYGPCHRGWTLAVADPSSSGLGVHVLNPAQLVDSREAVLGSVEHMPIVLFPHMPIVLDELERRGPRLVGISEHGLPPGRVVSACPGDSGLHLYLS